MLTVDQALELHQRLVSARAGRVAPAPSVETVIPNEHGLIAQAVAACAVSCLASDDRFLCAFDGPDDDVPRHEFQAARAVGLALGARASSSGRVVVSCSSADLGEPRDILERVNLAAELGLSIVFVLIGDRPKAWRQIKQEASQGDGLDEGSRLGLSGGALDPGHAATDQVTFVQVDGTDVGAMLEAITAATTAVRDRHRLVVIEIATPIGSAADPESLEVSTPAGSTHLGDPVTWLEHRLVWAGIDVEQLAAVHEQHRPDRPSSLGRRDD